MPFFLSDENVWACPKAYVALGPQRVEGGGFGIRAFRCSHLTEHARFDAGAAYLAASQRPASTILSLDHHNVQAPLFSKTVCLGIMRWDTSG